MICRKSSSRPRRCYSGFKWQYGLPRRDEGSALIELALLLPVFLLLFVGSIDFGRAFYAAIEVSSAAEAAAWYGAQQPSDTSGIQAAAVLDAADVNNLTATVASGCQCSDGSSVEPGCTSVPSGCSANVVSYVQVITNATYTPILKYPGIPSTIPLQGVARMRSAY
jgi:Flp pilus assembly protein TadG